jgi:BirA family biotin operon repressor/biotin-[acetyl-CoA-carboxylase] ligase
MDRVHFVILGIGVNLNMDEKKFSKEIRSIATSLKIEMGQTVSRKAFLQSLLLELERWYSIFLEEGGVVLKAWRDRADIRGREVKVTSFGETVVGTAIDVDSDGALILETREGKQTRVMAGDVEYSKKIEAPNIKHQISNKSQCPKF